MSFSGRILAGFLVLAAFTFSNAAVTCVPAAAPMLVRAEGVTERVGDIVLNCSGAASETLAGNLALFLPVRITNRVASDGTLDVLLNAESAGSFTPPRATLAGARGVEFNGLSLSLPATGSASLRVSNLRAAISDAPDSATPVIASISFTGSRNVLLTSASVTVAIPQRGVLAGSSAGIVNCYGSPLPKTIGFSSLVSAGTRVFSTRVTEGFNGAFEAAGPGLDNGVRFLVRYSGFPDGARLFVPDAIAGSSARQPTGGGDLKFSPAGGDYSPSERGSLLLLRVSGADANGAGGELASIEGGFEAVTEVKLVNGAATAVYEVADANPALRENAEIPTFIGMPVLTGPAVVTAKQLISAAPVSTVAAASETAPILRFADVTPPLDCTELDDCDAFPKLFLNAPKPFTFTAPAGGKRMSEFASVQNVGGGTMAWTATVTYKNGAGWISMYIEPPRGVLDGWFRVDVDPSKVVVGSYEATVSIDAGPTAGSAELPVTLTVTPAAAAGPRVNAVVHAATFERGAIVPGSLASLMGSGLKGANVSVTFDGIAATLLYVGDSQVNFYVPAELRLRSSAQMVITVDGAAGAPIAVELVEAAPAVFANGVLNQDGFVNGERNPAPAGTVLQVFLTGLPASDAGEVSATLGGREITPLEYAGPAPSLLGVQQVNLRVPANFSGGAADLQVCVTDKTNAQKTCSPAFPVMVR
jgi:uncharacterized protein (TIGR03437 family)